MVKSTYYWFPGHAISILYSQVYPAGYNDGKLHNLKASPLGLADNFVKLDDNAKLPYYLFDPDYPYVKNNVF